VIKIGKENQVEMQVLAVYLTAQLLLFLLQGAR
jgi:hypothetical protein